MPIRSRTQIEVFRQVDKPGEWYDRPARSVLLRERMGIRVRTWQRREVGLAPDFAALIGNALDHVGECYTALDRVGQYVTAHVAGGLKTDTGDPRPLLSE